MRQAHGAFGACWGGTVGAARRVSRLGPCAQRVPRDQRHAEERDVAVEALLWGQLETAGRQWEPGRRVGTARSSEREQGPWQR